MLPAIHTPATFHAQGRGSQSVSRSTSTETGSIAGDTPDNTRTMGRTTAWGDGADGQGRIVQSISVSGHGQTLQQMAAQPGAPQTTALQIHDPAAGQQVVPQRPLATRRCTPGVVCYATLTVLLLVSTGLLTWQAAESSESPSREIEQDSSANLAVLSGFAALMSFLAATACCVRAGRQRTHPAE